MYHPNINFIYELTLLKLNVEDENLEGNNALDLVLGMDEDRKHKGKVCQYLRSLGLKTKEEREQKATNALDPKSNKCKVCEKSFKKHKDLTLHKRIHDNENPFLCLACRKRFAKKDPLTRHQKKCKTLQKVVDSKIQKYLK